MDQLNPVVVIVGFFAALFGGGGGATIIVSLINRKAAAANKTDTLEKASARFREEVRKENNDLKAEIREMKAAFIQLAVVLSDLEPKLNPALELEERILLRDALNQARLVI